MSNKKIGFLSNIFRSNSHKDTSNNDPIIDEKESQNTNNFSDDIICNSSSDDDLISQYDPLKKNEYMNQIQKNKNSEISNTMYSRLCDISLAIDNFMVDMNINQFNIYDCAVFGIEWHDVKNMFTNYCDDASRITITNNVLGKDVDTYLKNIPIFEVKIQEVAEKIQRIDNELMNRNDDLINKKFDKK